jgi:S-adenosylmethionine synthetase
MDKVSDKISDKVLEKVLEKSLDGNLLNTENKNIDILQVKQYICNICLELDKSNLISILNFLKKEHVDVKYFNQNNDGIKINLDLIDDILIIKLYNYIKYKLAN